MKNDELKKVVKERYGNIAKNSFLLSTESCCVKGTCCDEVNYTTFSDDYSTLPGYNPDADLNLGCGIPTDKAAIMKGDSVLDLGSGAGNDCFVARAFTGEEGKVTGLDFTEAMIKKAINNLEKTGFKNIEFVFGDVEEMPFKNNQFDVVISNCVLNLVPDKTKAFSEIYRVLKPGGHFCISDVVLIGDLPKKLKKNVEMYAGCVSGALQREEYLSVIKRQGFSDIEINKESRALISDEILINFLTEVEFNEFKTKEFGIVSITVSAKKI